MIGCLKPANLKKELKIILYILVLWLFLSVHIFVFQFNLDILGHFPFSVPGSFSLKKFLKNENWVTFRFHIIQKIQTGTFSVFSTWDIFRPGSFSGLPMKTIA